MNKSVPQTLGQEQVENRPVDNTSEDRRTDENGSDVPVIGAAAAPRRLAYCKNSDAVAELERFGASPDRIYGGGGQYITSFLHYRGERPALLLSLGDRQATVRQGNVEARVYHRQSGTKRPAYVLWAETTIALQFLWQLIRFRPDHILSAVSAMPLWACWVYGGLFRVPLVCTRHSSLYGLAQHKLGKVLGRVNRWCVRRADAVICHGPYLERELLDLGVPRENLFVFNNSYDYLETGGEAPAPEFLAGGKANGRLIVYAGSIRRDKGVFDLVEASRALLQADPHLRLAFAGSGRDSAEFSRFVEQSEFFDRIGVLGYVDHASLVALMRAADLVVTPSHSRSTESVCKVVIEALVLGIPVLAPSFGPFPYFVKNTENGLLFEPDSVQDLGVALKRFFENVDFAAKLRLGAQASGQQYVHSSFTFEQALASSFER